MVVRPYSHEMYLKSKESRKRATQKWLSNPENKKKHLQAITDWEKKHYDDMMVIQMHHINGDGAKHRREFDHSSKMRREMYYHPNRIVISCSVSTVTSRFIGSSMVVLPGLSPRIRGS